MPVELSKEIRKQAIASIRRYFAEKTDEEIGDLKAELLLDYFLAEIGPSIYNRAVADAQSWFQEKTGDLDVAFHRPEFVYWD
ncbi:MAG: DUF2164 domain-containing protein [Planctomycetota bacterium]|jgi:uncharacterized protein (DUF2164 family)